MASCIYELGSLGSGAGQQLCTAEPPVCPRHWRAMGGRPLALEELSPPGGAPGAWPLQDNTPQPQKNLLMRRSFGVEGCWEVIGLLIRRPLPGSKPIPMTCGCTAAVHDLSPRFSHISVYIHICIYAYCDIYIYIYSRLRIYIYIHIYVMLWT